MRVLVDAMGGDHAPAVVVEGAVQAACDGVEVLLVGPEDVVRGELARHAEARGAPIEIVPAAAVIEMHEHPVNAVRQKRDSSIVVAARLLKEGRGDALYSAGNSGAIMAAALLTLGRIRGIHRPAIGGILPLLDGRCLMIDIGANADCEAHHLYQFARMGAAYMEHVYGLAHPRIGLVSNGEEETKGNALVQTTIPLLKESGLNFVGNVEGRDVTRGVVDVIVCDGFTGNVMLKLAEGMQELIFDLIRREIRRSAVNRVAGMILRPGLRKAAKTLDYTEYGGAPLLGVDGVVFIGHGRSNAQAIRNGILAAATAARAGLLDAIRASAAAPGGASSAAMSLPGT